MLILRSLVKEVSARLESGESRESLREWVYEQLGARPPAEEALWWCHGLAGLWLFALGDSELFPDLELRFGAVLESVLSDLRQDNRKTGNLEEYALWLQAQLLHFFWNGSSSDLEIAEIESLGKLILDLSHENEGDFVFFSQLAFPPSFVAQDWSSFQESRLKILSQSRHPPVPSSRRKKMKLSQVLARRWSASIPDSDRRLG